ncbi:Pkinase-domain-containing protein [Cylindrobasidium torrendii FP15055 ss-10]|uniref:non-specific serine/threonine protein kinase n=1 Tax=Cylindrobasidium torrendii FP15055 ss-10 TaxID=1314674 RepID=A0A0D7B0E2_9AGAR|nr:Pkinase-domain-containing protein [Cylindrobasidium torrendii FP15055 ss-10]KIY62986.1 Pkinase-domain-containing protein [Cylindrobasidium torrendii FP15055 ss-10]
MITQEDAAPTESSEGQDSDKPPHGRSKSSTKPSFASQHVPMPPPDARAYPKSPGETMLSLSKANLASGNIPTPPPMHDKHISAGSASSTPSPSVSDSEWGSAPSTRANSRAPSRAPSMSAGTAGNKVTNGSAKFITPAKNGKQQPPPPHGSAPNSPSATLLDSQQHSSSTSTIRPKAPSVISHDGGGHKFTLKDLLANGPKLSRKSSQRSTGGSSRKSDGDSDAGGGGGGRARSAAGESVGSLTSKYGVCHKVAIGRGATSVVRLAHKWDRTEEKLYAIKEFRKRRKNETEKEYVKKLTAEFCISSTLHHVNIVETVDLVQDESAKWCEVMEFCPGGDLYAAIKKGGMSPSEVECCFKQIVSGVAYLHSQGVAHRDIKPENLFFDTKGHLKIGDYGASTVYRLPWETTVHMSTGLCGSEPYIAPEQFLGKPYDARLVDIWACGIVYYCLHFQELPWRAAQVSDAMYASYAQACVSSPTPPPTIQNLSPRGCRSLIRQMLEPNPKKRVTIEEVARHEWVGGIEVCWKEEKARHVHVHAQSLAQAQMRELAAVANV